MDKSIREKIRERIKQHGETYKICQLCLDEIQIFGFTPQLAKIVEKCNNIEYITLQNCNLQSLMNFPSLLKLTSLELDNNKFAGKQLLNINSKYPLLRELSLCNNNIENIEDIICLEAFRNLQKLNIQQNPIMKTEKYQQLKNKLFSILPFLILLDGKDSFGNTVQDRSDIDQFSESEAQFSEGEDESDEEMDSPQKMRKI